MLKFVSTKPPKSGKTSQANLSEKSRKKKGSFRWKIFSKRENPQTFEKDSIEREESEARREEEFTKHKMDERLGNEGDYDNFNSSKQTDFSQKALNGNVSYTRSWSMGSESSVDSYHGGSQSKKHLYDPYRGQGHPLRHVTWSPDVADTSDNPFTFETNYDSKEHDDYYWDNLHQLNSTQPFKLHHQGTCALEDQSGPFYQTCNHQTSPVTVQSHQSHPPCSRRLEYPRDQFVHHVGKPILNRKYEMYPSVTLPHRSKGLSINSAAANSYATVGPRTLKKDYRVPYSVPVSNSKINIGYQDTSQSISSHNRVSPPRELPINSNLMRNYSVPYSVPSYPISSPRELSVNSKLIFSPSIYSTPKRTKKPPDSDLRLKTSYDRNARVLTDYGQKARVSTDYDQISEDTTYYDGQHSKVSKPFTYRDDKYLDFIQNIRTGYPQQGTSKPQDYTSDYHRLSDSYQQGTRFSSDFDKLDDEFDRMNYGKYLSGSTQTTKNVSHF